MQDKLTLSYVHATTENLYFSRQRKLNPDCVCPTGRNILACILDWKDMSNMPHASARRTIRVEHSNISLPRLCYHHPCDQLESHLQVDSTRPRKVCKPSAHFVPPESISEGSSELRVRPSLKGRIFASVVLARASQFTPWVRTQGLWGVERVSVTPAGAWGEARAILARESNGSFPKLD